jgi:hypothetical protein
MNKNKPVYQRTDEIGVLPAPVLYVPGDNKNLWPEQLVGSQWVKLAERRNRRWISMFANLRIDQDANGISLGAIKTM